LTATSSGTISIGDGVVIDTGATLFSESSVRVGDGAVIGPNVLICDCDEEGHRGEVVIGPNVRVGAGARIVGPCRLDPGAVVLAGSVVRGIAGAAAVVGPERSGESATTANGKANGVATQVVANPKVEKSPVAARSVRAVLIADFTIDELAEHLAMRDVDNLVVESEIAPFDQVVPTLMTLSRADPRTELALVWTRPDQVSPAFRELLLGGTADVDRVLSEVDAFASVLKAHASAARFVFLPSWVLPPTSRGLGLLELRGPRSTNVLARMNLRLADAVSEIPNAFVLDAQRWLATASDGGVDPKLWYAGKVAFTTDVLSEAARDIRAALRGVLGISRKLVVVDLDDTMWGGIVGDVGWENLQLGGHDPNGEAFVQFQRQLLALTKRGIALAVVSKNEESTALEAMRRHPEMQIKPEMLAAFRINWRDKAQNILEITEELSLGLQSVVFLDDNPIERGRVREAFPEVYVPDWPSDPTHYPRALNSLRCFDPAHISAEDIERNAMYATERERSSLRSQVSSFDDWLATLDLKVRFERVGSSNIARAAQLLNKTNQMNLRTRRLSEPELLAWAGKEGHEAWAVHVSDRFGNAGLTGLLGLARSGDEVHLADYVLSCRVMGRRVEETLVWAAKGRAAALGGQKLIVSPTPTAKNKPCLEFFERAGLTKGADGYVEQLPSNGPPPSLITVEGLQ
jgi:FkbH-like protein